MCENINFVHHQQHLKVELYVLVSRSIYYASVGFCSDDIHMHSTNFGQAGVNLHALYTSTCTCQEEKVINCCGWEFKTKSPNSGSCHTFVCMHATRLKLISHHDQLARRALWRMSERGICAIFHFRRRRRRRHCGCTHGERITPSFETWPHQPPCTAHPKRRKREKGS